MEDPKTLFLYLIGVVGLITLSILLTGQIEPSEVEPPQSPPVTSTVTEVKATVNPSKAEQEVCSATNRIAYYRPDITYLESDPLVISGTVYASDFVTPLPKAPIEVWMRTEASPYQPQYPHPPHFPSNKAFRAWFQTDEKGHYEATVPKPGHYGIIYLYYQAIAQDHCPLRLALFFMDNLALRNTAWVSGRLMKLDLEHREPAGSVVRGPIDIVLPVPPSAP